MKLEDLKTTKNLFIVLLIITIFLRLINILSEQIWEDEGISLYIASAPVNEFWTFVINDIHPPLYYLILRSWCLIFGVSILSGRLLSVVFSVLTAPILYLIGKKLRNEKLGLIIMFLYSISPFSIYYANEIRSYSLLLLSFTIGLYFTINILMTPKTMKNYFFLGIIGVILVYTHYIGIIYFGILCLSIFIFNRRERKFYKNILASMLVVIFCYIPWVPYALQDVIGGSPGYAGGRLNIISLFYWAFNLFLSPVPSYIDDPYVLNLIILTFIINIPLMILSILSLIGFIDLLRLEKKSKPINFLFYILLTTGLLFGIPIILGIILENSFTAKNLIGGLSLIYMIEGFGLYHLFFEKNFHIQKYRIRLLRPLNPHNLKKVIHPLVTLLLICNLLIYPIFRASYLQKPDWDGCFKKLESKFKSNDIVIIAYDGGGYSKVMEYYSSKNNFDLDDNFYELDYDEDEIEEFFEDLLKENITRIWIINFWEKARDPQDKTEELLIDEYDLEEIDQYFYRLDITLTLYKI